METIAMKCASCGAGLQIAPDMDHFACGYCGASLSVVRLGGTVALRLVADLIAKVQVGTDRTASELAIVRLPKEIATLQRELNAMEERRCHLENEIIRASSPQTGSRKASLIANHTRRAIIVGSALGLFMGYFLDAIIPTTIAVYVGLFFAVVFAVGDFSNPLRVVYRSIASSEDLIDESRRQSVPFNTEELQKLGSERSVLIARLQELNRQMAVARAVVDS